MADAASTVDANGKSYVVRGTLFYPDKSWAVGLKVAAFDQDIGGENRLGDTVTGANGSFRIAYTEAQFRSSPSERRGADIFVRVYSARHDLIAKSKTVRNASADLALNVEVPAPTFVVRGQIRYADGTPAAGIVVQAHDRDVRLEEPLGLPTTSDYDGRFTIPYATSEFARAEKRSADLRVSVRHNGLSASSEILFNAPADAVIDVALPWSADKRSEFDLLVEELLPLLKDQAGRGQNLAIDALEATDIDFLASDTEIARQRIEWLVLASMLAHHTTSRLAELGAGKPVRPSPEPSTSALSAEVFYAWFRLGIPAEPTGLWATPTDILISSLAAAVEQRVVPATVGDHLDDVRRRIEQIKRDRALETRAPGTGASLGDLLGTLPTPLAQSQTDIVAPVLATLRADDPRLVEQIASIAGFEGDPVPVARTLWLGALTGGHLPLVTELQRLAAREDTSPARRSRRGRATATANLAAPAPGALVRDLRPLAALELSDWKLVLQRRQPNGEPIGVPPETPGVTADEQLTNYATSLLNYVEIALPTAVIASRVARDNGADSPFAGVQADLETFLVNNPAFELGTMSIDVYLKEKRDEKLANVVDAAAMLVQAKNIGRVSRLTPHYPEIRALLTDDLHSALAVVDLGQRRFIQKHVETFGGPEEALAVFRKAEQVHGAALNVYMKYGAGFNSPLPYVISGGTAADEPAHTGIAVSPGGNYLVGPQHLAGPTGSEQYGPIAADWARLFGSIDLCDCEHCKSLYSPAAYFVDVLKFLDDTKSIDNPLEVLMGRRPDLQHIELTCENSTTRLPYIDLTNEILEATVAPRTFVIPDGAELKTRIADLAAGNVPVSFQAPFRLAGYPLTAEASVRADRSGGVIVGTEWMVLDRGWAFELQHQAPAGGFRVTAWPQTSWTADELRANPEHVHDAAYAILSDAVYPWTLPFNLPVEEARVYLRHLGVPRPEVMETFFRGKAADAGSDEGVAHEYLGLTAVDAGIITGAAINGVTIPSWDFWGLAESGNQTAYPNEGTAWGQVLAQVPVFLRQSGLTYPELLELLGTYFINPVNSDGMRPLSLVAISHDVNGKPVDPTTCDLHKLRIETFDVPLTLDRIHRFIRLQRRLGWTIRELDQAIDALTPDSPPPTLDEELLVALSHVQRLRTELNLPLVNMLTWWSDIATRSYVDQLADGQPAVVSLYQQLFRNKAVINPLDDTFTDDGKNLTGTFGKHLPALIAALGLTAADLSRLMAGSLGVLPTDAIDLAGLSGLYRVASLAKTLKLTVREYQTVLRMSVLDPFLGPAMSGPAATLRFVEHVAAIRTSGFGIDELAYVLRHDVAPSSGIAPTEADLAASLYDMRSALQSITAQNTFREDPADLEGVTTDPRGELTRQKLALLNWDTAMIEDVVATLNGVVVYEAFTDAFANPPLLLNDTGSLSVSLVSRPAGLVLPAALSGVVSVAPKFLFPFDAATPVETAAGGTISVALRQKFGDNQINLAATAPVTVNAPDTSWTIDGRYSIARTGNLVSVSDQDTLELRASRVLSDPERVLLAAGSTNADFTGAVTRLVKLQDELQGPIAYDEVTVNGQVKGRLRFTGPMTNARKLRLETASADQSYRDAVKQLYEAPRNFIARYARTFSVPDFATQLTVLPALAIPNALTSRIYFDAAATPSQLHFIGIMTDQQRETLLALSTDMPYQDAVNRLYGLGDPAQAPAPEPGDEFLTAPTPVSAIDPAKDTARLFDNPSTPEARFLIVLRKLLPHLRRTLGERALVQTLADALGLESRMASDLLTRFVYSPSESTRKVITDFQRPSFAESNVNAPLTPAAYPEQFAALALLHKVGLVVGKLTLTPAQLGWLFEHASEGGWLDLNALPVAPMAATASSAAFVAWERLVDLFRLQKALPFGEMGLFDLFDVARAAMPATLNSVRGAAKNAYLAGLEQRTSWAIEDLEVLLGRRRDHRHRGDLGFVFPDAYTDERMLLQLRECFKRMKRIGASARQLSDWGKTGQTAAEERANAASIKNAAKGKHTDKQWLAVAKALRDPLREKQRSALMSYLLARPNVANGRRWRDAAELYEHLLVDVEMGACMTSTRLLQATNSAQLFIQRCLMNLEYPDVRLMPEDVQQWTQWRRQYRLWEANRKVLFYPENWIEPELRDDKSPFFEELETELLQNELTTDRAEDAFLHYLEKVDQVGRLEIVGMYREQEPSNGHGPLDTLHVFGRTTAIPHVHFYRRLQGGAWTAWESVDLDIEGDHLLPVVWNRRLNLIWPIFTEKTDPVTKAQRVANDDTVKYWEIKFAWSEYKRHGWSPKRLSEDSLRQNQHLQPNAPDSPNNVLQTPRDVSFKTRVDGDRLLIECYGGVVTGDIRTEVLTTPPPEFPLVTEFIAAVAPHGDTFGVHATAIRVRFTVNGVKPTKAERGRISLQIRRTSGTAETVALNSQGGADSSVTYTDPVLLLDVQSRGFKMVGIQDVGSWWMPFNPVAYIESVVETISDAIADAVENDPAGAAKFTRDLKTAIDVAVAAVVLSGGGAIPVVLSLLSVLPAAASAAASAALTLGLGRAWGRKLVIDLQPLPVPQATITTKVSDSTALARMRGIGVFALDDCHGTIRGPKILDPASLPALGTLPRARIENMMFVEDSSPGVMMIGGQSLQAPSDPMSVSVQLLNKTPGTFRLLAPHQDRQFSPAAPFFFQDDQRAYLVSGPQQWVFAIHYHPRICELIARLKREGIGGLLRLPERPPLTDTGSTFLSAYFPNPVFVPPNLAPREGVDFSREGAYSLYNWELFFHVPFLIATQLTKNQRFAEAQKWFHYIFDPTATDSPEKPDKPGPERFWRVEPLYQEALRPIQTLEALIAESETINAQITEWQANPFKPHVIARMRVVAYMKAIVMRYIDNLIAWGDQLFRQDTIETINEATQLYVLAGQILGARAEHIPARARAKVQTYRTLDDTSALNSLSNAVVAIENFLPPSAAPVSVGGTQGGSLLMPFFCITANDKLLGYWDTVADRLFKIRHCLNIEGVERALPLFQPAIDPGLLVRAAAAGVDLASVLSDLNAAVPHYRFNVMLQKATELCNDVKALGAALLSALEKKDGEELALLRSTHEVELLKAIRDIKKQQIQEASDMLAGLLKYQEVVTARQQYYQSRAFINPQEAGHLDMVKASLIPLNAQAGAEVIAAVLHLIPELKIGGPTTAGTTYGGSNVAGAIQSTGSAAGIAASILNTSGSLSATLGGYQRRQDDWTHQGDLATKELQQGLKQVAAAEIRLAIAERELENHDLQIENAKDVDDFMRHRKFTNQELYSWMVGKLSGIYFQGYQLAYDVAKRAERTFRYELGLRDSNFIQFGYWDSLKKGLLSGERLHHDLKRMDVAYMDQNRREYEITKHISLNAIDPISLINLKETGECFLTLPEALFDLDYPGHYLRRVKTVSITIPCVTGPYVGVNCTLTQLNSSIRHANTLSGNRYARKEEDTRFSDSFGIIQSIVTSGGQNDSGLFEANLRDERYLPFEGQGAIGTWRIQLPMQFKSFDYDTISDVVLHLRYTARDGGEPLRQHAATELSAALERFAQAEGEQGLARAFSLRHEFPTEWYRFLNPPSGHTDDQTLILGLTRERFPFLFQERISGIGSMELFVKVNPGFAESYNDSTLKLSLAAGTAASSAALPVAASSGLLRATKSPAGPPGDWTLTAWVDGTPHMRLDPDAIQDILLVARYSCA